MNVKVSDFVPKFMLIYSYVFSVLIGAKVRLLCTLSLDFNKFYVLIYSDEGRLFLSASPFLRFFLKNLDIFFSDILS